MDIHRSINLVLTSSNVEFDYVIFFVMIGLVLLSGFFSMTETVFSSVNVVRLRIQVEEGKKGAKKALYCAENFNNTLTTLLIGNNIVNIGLATISVGFFAKFIAAENIANIVSTGVITVVVLIFGEILPKTIAKTYSDKLALVLGQIIYILYIILFPFVSIFKGIQKGVQGKETNEPKVNEAELEVILDTMEEEGAIESEEVELIQNILELNDKTVRDIMTPRVDVIFIEVHSPIEKIKDILFECQYSRIPVFDADKDKIVGILFEREFLTNYIQNPEFDVATILKPVTYVSTSMKVNNLIHELQKNKMHLAIVSGEYGETAGVVTMEDALEELVGEIYDEHDNLEDDILIKKISDNTYNLNASIYLEDLFDELELGKVPDCEANKLSGWLYSLGESIPEEGQECIHISKFVKKDEDDAYVDVVYKLTFEITKVEDRRIIDVQLTIEDYIDDEEVESE
ncbi:MAG: hemolysin family protein [bacterium]